MNQTLTIFEEKAIGDLALALVDPTADKTALPALMESTARAVGCTTAELAVYLHGALCSIMTYPRTLDCFDQPMIDIAQARRFMRQARQIGRMARYARPISRPQVPSACRAVPT